MKTTIIEVLTNSHKVGDGYFSFDYVVNVNGKIKDSGTYENDYDIPTKKMEKELKNGYDIDLVMQTVFG